MKNSRKIFGAVALSAVLAFGMATPAFAVNNENLDTGDAVNYGVAQNAAGDPTATNASGVETYDENSTNGASTSIDIATYSSHYSVTVPLKLPFMLDQVGGLGMSPTNYYIQNNGTDAAVEIWSVEYSMENNSGNKSGNDYYYTFGIGAGDLASNSNLTSLASTAPANNKPLYGSYIIEATATSMNNAKTAIEFRTVAEGNGNTGQINGVTYEGSNSATKADGVSQVTSALYGLKEFGKGDWQITKASKGTAADGSDEPTVCEIGLKITGTALTNADERNLEDVASFVYTIGPARTTLA